MLDVNEFSSLKIGLATAAEIQEWSHGEVKKPETINYRTLKPEKDGLFCEKIFGPTRDWECSCGKYKKRVRFKGMICERCGVEVTRSKVRRERMGHIRLAAPVSHIWFFKGVPSRMGYLLDLPSKSLERVLYFASYIVVDVKKEKRDKDLKMLENKLNEEIAEIEAELAERHQELDDRLGEKKTVEETELDKRIKELEAERDKAIKAIEKESKKKAAEHSKTKEERIAALQKEYDGKIGKENTAYEKKAAKLAETIEKEKAEAADALQVQIDYLRELFEDFKSLDSKQLVDDDQKFRDLRERWGIGNKEKKIPAGRYGEYFSGGMGAETVRELLRDLDARISLDQQYDKFSGLKAKEKEDKTRTAEEKKADEEKERKELRDIFARLNGKDAPIETMVQICELKGGIRAGGLTEKEVDDKLKKIEKQKESGKAGDDKKKVVEEKKRLTEQKKLYVELGDLRSKVEKEVETGTKEKGVDVHEANKLMLEAEELRWTIRKSQGQKRNKASKRLKVVSSFLKTYNKPEAMIMDVIPVIPPDLRPMVQLDGGRFATSDLNDLYRRVINRNNRLTRLNELGAPEIIVNNEKRMLQEAVDALFDNGRRGRPVTGPGNRPLKSLSDMLKGKQGRFRQNLLGKRVDYSGRSVIVVGPELKLHQCGLPKQMALELFKPFVMKRLVDLGFAHNIKGAKRMIDRMIPIVWDVLEKVIHEHPVFLNRAPTLHRLGIQAFEPLLVEGKAIRIHPLVCTAFNADFDGDQMAVHLPLSAEAQAEARILMLSAHNILSPAHGKPIVTPTQDMVLGCWFLTAIKEGAQGSGKVFPNEDYAILATEYHGLDLQAPIKVRMPDGEMLETTAGRLIFNRTLPEAFPYQNRVVGKKEVAEIVDMVADLFDSDVIVRILDRIKDTGFHYATRAGITIGVEDIEVPPDKPDILARADKEVSAIEERYRNGFYTEEERHERVVDVWHGATDQVSDSMEHNFNEFNPIYMMARSGARGDLKQIKQLAGMKGLVEDPKGDIIASPITSNFREGLSVLEYFISTHGARKGLADTALRTADSGYLTRRLVDVAQDVIVREEDCETDRGIPVKLRVDGEINPSALGRRLLEDVKSGRTTLVKANEEITRDAVERLLEAGIEEVRSRSVLTCRAKHGVCSSCYGRNMATGKRTPIGEAIGIIAAQSIGEPGTQLTMRTFHFGGVYTGAGRDITHGLPRVVELFEARKPKGLAHLAPSRGKVEVIKGENKHQIILHGEKLNEKTRKMEPFDYPVFEPPASQKLLVSDGEEVAAGQQLTEGSADPKELLEILDRESVQLYLVSEVQKVYKDQGVDIHDKHIEIIVRQMLKRVTVSEPGDSEFLPGQLVEYMEFEAEAENVVAEGGQPPTFKEVLLGITKASLATDSFLSAASFQETTRVLTDAALSGKVDHLMGLKENVIIGKLIPTGSGMKRYRRINVKPKGEEWDSLYTGEISLEPQPQFTDIDSLAQVFGDDFADIDEEEVDTDVE